MPDTSMFKWLNLSWIPGCICNLVTAAIDVLWYICSGVATWCTCNTKSHELILPKPMLGKSLWYITPKKDSKVAFVDLSQHYNHFGAYS